MSLWHAIPSSLGFNIISEHPRAAHANIFFFRSIRVLLLAGIGKGGVEVVEGLRKILAITRNSPGRAFTGSSCIDITIIVC